MSTLLQTVEIETAPNPTAAIIVLHGLGADGNDFVPICNELDLDAVGPVRYVFPHSPHRPVTVNGGMVMPAWYDIKGFGLVDQEDEAGLRQSQAQISALIEREIERGIAPQRIVLMGFSQGCAMTLMTGLRYPARLAGLVCLSGYLPLASKLAAERHAANADVPIFMGHGRMDPVVQIARGTATRDALLKFGYAVEWHEYPMQHSVHPQEIADLNRWLVARLG